jgi:hypothetical protein
MKSVLSENDRDAFWLDESYDRLVRGEKEFERIENYILQNPVRARAEARCRLKPAPQFITQ